MQTTDPCAPGAAHVTTPLCQRDRCGWAIVFFRAPTGGILSPPIVRGRWPVLRSCIEARP